MNDHDLDLLVRGTLERDAASQPVSSDLHQRSLLHGRRVVRRRRVTGVAATAVVAAAALVVVSIRGSAPPAPTSPVPPTLTSVVKHVRALPAEKLPTTGFWAVAVRASLHGKATDGVEWVGPDGTAREVLGGTVVETPASSGQVILPWTVLASLPTQPAALMARLRQVQLSMPFYNYTDATIRAMEITAEILGKGPTSPALRAALIEGLGETAGVRVTGTGTDVAGETGLAFTYRVEQVAYVVLVSPSTGRALEFQYTSPYQRESGSFLHQAAVPDDHTGPPGSSYAEPTRASTTVPAEAVLADLAAHATGPIDAGLLKPSWWWYDRILTTTGTKTSTTEVWLSHKTATRTLVDVKKPRTTYRGSTALGLPPGPAWTYHRFFDSDPAEVYGEARQYVENAAGADAPAETLAGDTAYYLVWTIANGQFDVRQRAGILGALARTGGTVDAGAVQARDRLGRPALVIIPPQGGESVGKRYLFDPQSGALLEMQAPGAITTYVVQGSVPNSQALPGGISPVRVPTGH